MVKNEQDLQHNFQDIIDSISETLNINLPSYKKNTLCLNFLKDEISHEMYEKHLTNLPFSNSDVFYATITNWRRLSAINHHCKAVYEMNLDVTGSKFDFRAGDTIGIVPCNSKEDVDSVLEHLNLISLQNTIYTLTAIGEQKSNKIPAHIPETSTLRYVLTQCVDLRAIIKKLFLLALSRYTKDENERRILEYLCSKEGAAKYTTHILNKNICLLDLFSIFKSCQPPVEVLLAYLPRILPRPYSIINNKQRSNNLITICFSVMDLENNRKGLTTGWIEKLILQKKENDITLENGIRNLSITNNQCGINQIKIPIYMRKNIAQFFMPENMKVPLILIGPGTGVAPFLGFLEERESFIKRHPDSDVGYLWLFTGCRNPKLDFIYETELNKYVSKGILNKLTTTFSRVEGLMKYVQDAILEHSKAINKLIEDGASIFVCGDVQSMAPKVRVNIVTCLMNQSSRSLQEAEEYVSDMEKNKRYIVEVWS